MNNAVPVLSVIVPAFRAATTLRACLAGITGSNLPRAQYELLVVDDCSDDNTAAVAGEFADTVLTTVRGPRGPAAARNIGAKAARGSVLVFIDSDVVVAPHTLAGFIRCLGQRVAPSAVFGAYDDTPAHPGFVSQYRNLLHRYVHLQHAGPATTFWAGCGAVNRAAFLAVGGFDEWRYPRPQIEDIDLGYRLSARGYPIALEPELSGKHLKHWTFGSVLRTDFRDRAVPWMHLLIERRATVGNGPLNVSLREKLLTALSALSLGSLVLAAWSTTWLWLAGVSLAIIVAGNVKLLAWFLRERGVWFALRVVPMRILFYLVSGAGAAWAIATHRFRRGRPAQPELRTTTDAADVR